MLDQTLLSRRQHSSRHSSEANIASSRVFRFFLAFALATGCAALLANVLSSQNSNPVAMLLLISGIVLSFYALIKPWPAFLLFVWLSVTIDTFKRITYAASDMNQIDVAEILLVPVLLIAALYLRIAFLQWFGQDENIDPINYKKFLPVLGLCVLAPLAMLKKSGLSFSAVKENYTFICYIPAALTIPHLLNSPGRWRTFSRQMFWICLAVGAYGLVQVVHGPFEYERVYMESGLTTTISLMEEGFFRPFSLLNTGPTFAGMMVIGTFFALYRISLTDGRLRLGNRRLLLLLAFCLAVCVLSTQRGPVLCALLVIPLLPLFQRPRLLQLAFLLGVSLFALLILRIDDVWLFVVQADQYVSRMHFNPLMSEHTSLLTFGARVDSFHMLYDPSIWTPFGNGMRSDAGDGHDLLTNLVIWIGYVGLTIFLLLLAALLGLTGRLLQRLRSRGDRSALVWAQVNLAVLLYVIVWSFLFGSVIHVSPMNFYFWLAVGNLLFLSGNPRFLESAPSRSNVPTVTDAPQLADASR